MKILYGDIDGDGIVDGDDFLMTFDGKTDGADMQVWKQNFGATVKTATTTAALGE